MTLELSPALAMEFIIALREEKEKECGYICMRLPQSLHSFAMTNTKIQRQILKMWATEDEIATPATGRFALTNNRDIFARKKMPCKLNLVRNDESRDMKKREWAIEEKRILGKC